MKISLLQRDVVWGSPSKNIQQANDAIKALPKSDLYVLPEMFSTGFVSEPNGMAESENGESLAWMKLLAHELDAAIAGSVAVSTANGYRNRFYFVKPDGEVTYYDKRHLFTYGGEHKRYAAGDSRVVVEFRGVRFMLSVCYDLRFPTWLRNHEDYDCLLTVANWPTVRLGAWNVLLHARAIENQCYVCGVNRVGNDPACEYSGGTMCIDAYGRDVAACAAGQEDAVTVELDMDRLRSFRQKFPVLKDQDQL
ncbi:MAG: amidohydrolase [Paludibacteraceae bacterium]|nr:amidohydrolase [Paludibacteraceae bacterium]